MRSLSRSAPQTFPPPPPATPSERRWNSPSPVPRPPHLRRKTSHVEHRAFTIPPLLVLTSGLTQFSSTSICGEPPSGHVPALVSAAEKLSLAREMQLASRTESPCARA